MRPDQPKTSFIPVKHTNANLHRKALARLAVVLSDLKQIVFQVSVGPILNNFFFLSHAQQITF